MDKLDMVMRAMHGGVKPGHFKNTAGAETVQMPPPETVCIPMQQHIGAPCTPLVKKGDPVYLGQVIGDSDQPVSAPVHASVSGRVTGLGEVMLPGGQRVQTVHIESDGLMTPDPTLAPPPAETPADLAEAARACGLVGLGGAGFPTHIKLQGADRPQVDTLIVNAAECEPYITADCRECLENPGDILAGVLRLQKILGFKQVIIAVEDNKPEAVVALLQAAKEEKAGRTVRILTPKTRYPQGAEKVLIYTATGRRLPPGRLPADVGCLVMNVTSVAVLERYLRTGMPLTSRRVTVDGSAVARPMNVEVPIGTSVEDVIQFCGGYKCPPRKVLMGGPMMGLALEDTSIPVLKQNNAILAFGEKEAKLPQPTPCIRCGRCVKACPMYLRPAEVDRSLKLDKAEVLKKLGAEVCIECGSCAYVCPAKRPLVQSMRLAKARLKKEGGK